MAYLKSHFPYGSSTPTVEKSEGVRPAQHFVVAGYMPVVRFDQKVGWWKVISTGKVLARDKDNYIVLAGLAKDIETALANSNNLTSKNAFISNSNLFANVYSINDVQTGVKNFQGELVTAGEPVVASFFEDYDASKTLLNYVSKPIGIAPYDIWMQNGAGYGEDNDAGNPMDYTFTNFNLQQGLSVLTRYFIEVPVVYDVNQIKYPGLTVFEGNPHASSLVTFNARSNFICLTDAMIEERGAKVFGEILGKILFIDNKFPKDFLEWVKVPFENIANQDVTDVPTGTASNGLPHNLYYAGVTDPSQAVVVRINLII